jgi:hypothetical protein
MVVAVMGYRSAPDIKRPSEQLEDLMYGRTSWDDTPEAIRSWARFGIYQAARQIVAEPEMGLRRNMIGRVPAHMRAMVQAEVKRLWPLRK